MSQEASVRENQITPLSIDEKGRKTPSHASIQELLASLKGVKDDISQICELTSEEKSLVAVFFESLSKLMKPLTSTVPVTTTALPLEMAGAVQASLDPKGHLLINYGDGRLEMRDLREPANRDLMIRVIMDALPRFQQLTATYRRKVEQRIKILSSITKELQPISNALSEETASQ